MGPLGIQYDHFIRTTEPRHHETVRWLFERCLANGYVYKGSYTGQYCVSDELYVNDAKPGDNCPDCGRPTETVTEENYFFKLSAFAEKLLQHYEDNPDFIQPGIAPQRSPQLRARRPAGSLHQPHHHQMGHPARRQARRLRLVRRADRLHQRRRQRRRDPLWPADLHLIGKEILRFHAVFWPAFLMAAELPLPKRIFAHGWLLFENDKMSKSRGNIVRAEPIREVMGIEALRYFLFREIVFGQDGSFSYDALVGRYNSELANGLGNLASRTLTMIKQYRDGVIPQPSGDVGTPLAEAARTAIDQATRAFDAFEFSRGLEAIWTMLSGVDKFIVEQAPWKLAKAASRGAAAAGRCALCLGRNPAHRRRAAASRPARIDREHLGAARHDAAARARSNWRNSTGASLRPGRTIGRSRRCFRASKRRAPSTGCASSKKRKPRGRRNCWASRAREGRRTPEGTVAPPSPKIDIDDFVKVDLRVGLVLSAEPVKGADKLLHLKVDIGEPEPRTIVAGIAAVYKPEQMVGRKVVIVANLQPRKLRGIESNGMIVAASLEGGKPVLAGFLEDVPVGARLK